MTDQNNGTPPSAASPTYGAQLDPALKAELDRQAAVEADRTYAGGGGAGFWKPKKPAKNEVGQVVENFILVLPAEYPVTSVVPWISTAEHQSRRQGQFYSITCPEHDAKINGVVAPFACDACVEMKRRFSMMRDYPKGSPEAEQWKTEGKKLGERDRHFFHVFDLLNPQEQNWDGEGGKAVPAIWGVGRGQKNEIAKIVGDIGPIWIPTGFTPLKVAVSRVGTEDRDIRYDVRPVIQQINQGVLPPGWEGVLENLTDLNQQRKMPSPQEIHAFLHGGNPTTATPTGNAAPPPAMITPGMPPNPYAAQQPAAAYATPTPAPGYGGQPPPLAAQPAPAAPVAAMPAPPAGMPPPPAAAAMPPPPAAAQPAPPAAAMPAPPVAAQPQMPAPPIPPPAAPAAAPAAGPPPAAAAPIPPPAAPAQPAPAAPAPAAAGPTPAPGPSIGAPALPPVPSLPPIPGQSS